MIIKAELIEDEKVPKLSAQAIRIQDCQKSKEKGEFFKKSEDKNLNNFSKIHSKIFFHVSYFFKFRNFFDFFINWTFEIVR